MISAGNLGDLVQGSNRSQAKKRGILEGKQTSAMTTAGGGQ
jgi:hypothetical protein